MKISMSLVLSVSCLLAAPACDSAKKDAKPESGETPAAAAAEAGAKDAEAKDAEAKDAEPPAADGDAAAADGDAEAAEPAAEIGVAECDEYIVKMNACFAGDAIPEENRKAKQTGFQLTVKAWADSAKEHPESTANLVQGCKAAMDAARKMYPACFEGQ